MRISILLLLLALLLPGGASVFAEETERLIPWPSLGGKPHPDEAALATADWTTVSRQALAPRGANDQSGLDVQLLPR